eukprot:CAMPEP_0117657306 /NCGR_PEP_ID=MMETSP0804-20121206/5260_1 /TAXON_ID=1074897 /ORGANISM="Tetraselmis astigmatica, Strain CCMP880" /LENGTH=96 /DNA_ID=CAMNT_0005463751 /DNA_START=243 /DNA_END=531 /DNA_ORIENTATION=-
MKPSVEIRVPVAAILRTAELGLLPEVACDTVPGTSLASASSRRKHRGGACAANLKSGNPPVSLLQLGVVWIHCSEDLWSWSPAAVGLAGTAPVPTQ